MRTILFLFAVLIFGLVSCGDSDTPPISVTDVTLTPASLNLIVGQTETLTAIITPSDAHNQQKTWESSNNSIASVNNGQVTANAPGTATITVRTADGDFTADAEITVILDPKTDEGVMIADIRWATRNLDYPGTFAPYPHSVGRLYQWGTLNGETHHSAATGTVTGWNSSDNRTAWTAANDPCPQGWRVPTEAELHSLNNVGSVWTQQNGVNGRLFGTAPNQLFFPAVGHRNTSGTLGAVDHVSHVWSSTASGASNGWSLWLSSVISFVDAHNRAIGFSVRCVAE